ncbi:hypothetical protein FOZ63_019368 [Perkinsus olseni]|uniref:Uncharacterized protein n=1 Tax=Perkinsus olseni TaxID=32597 RepID=A0A7J6UJG1_PEROL|nr:hypothetical protein FOZ60_000737 [Perkinsus olseni]KAF4723997.1 hypothetical protein FOZ62_029979 [Perkinsus olseni]KAF4757384.1 hypothetical protein FOZ63_019368 [Perkinsus olseni]
MDFVVNPLSHVVRTLLHNYMSECDRLECQQCRKVIAPSRRASHTKRCAGSHFTVKHFERKLPSVPCPVCGREVCVRQLKRHQDSKRCDPTQQKRPRRERRNAELVFPVLIEGEPGLLGDVSMMDTGVLEPAVFTDTFVSEPFSVESSPDI